MALLSRKARYLGKKDKQNLPQSSLELKAELELAIAAQPPYCAKILYFLNRAGIG